MTVIKMSWGQLMDLDMALTWGIDAANEEWHTFNTPTAGFQLMLEKIQPALKQRGTVSVELSEHSQDAIRELLDAYVEFEEQRIADLKTDCSEILDQLPARQTCFKIIPAAENQDNAA